MQERNWLLHLLSPEGQVRNALDLSQKIVFEGSELYTDPRDAAAPVSLSSSLRPIMAIGQCRRAEALVSETPPDPLGHSPHASLRDSLSSFVKMGGLEPAVSR